MKDLISRQAVIDALELGLENDYVDATEFLTFIKQLPSAEPEIITIEELSYQLGCATIQSTLYWFEFLKTLDSLGFAIIKKETK